MDENFRRVVDEAVDDLSESGFDGVERVAYWQERIKRSAEAVMMGHARAERLLRESMAAIYRRLIERGGAIRYHRGIARFTIERLRPNLRAELDRRILASADLIKLNRREAIEKTLRRFAGWSTSIPRGGAAPGQRAGAKADVKKALKSLPFVERRVLIDQGHKLSASLNEIIAVDGGAIAGVWRSHWRQAGYDYRKDHRERDGVVYLVRDSWAHERGLVKRGPGGYYDQVTSAGEEPFCRCWVEWVHGLGSMPRDMLTKKGADALVEAKRKARTV